MLSFIFDGLEKTFLQLLRENFCLCQNDLSIIDIFYHFLLNTQFYILIFIFYICNN